MTNVTESEKRRLLPNVLETATNIATLTVAVLLSVVLVRNYLLPSASPFPTTSSQKALSAHPASSVSIGTDMSKRIPDVNWKANGQTLVLVLSTHCHFCTESAPFFRQLRERAGRNVRFIGVLPQAVTESKQYLSGEGLHLDEVRQLSLERTGAVGTPTLLLVSDDGRVKRTWVGKLEPDKQEEALRAIVGARSARSTATTKIISQRPG